MNVAAEAAEADPLVVAAMALMLAAVEADQHATVAV